MIQWPAQLVAWLAGLWYKSDSLLWPQCLVCRMLPEVTKDPQARCGCESELLEATGTSAVQEFICPAMRKGRVGVGVVDFHGLSVAIPP